MNKRRFFWFAAQIATDRGFPPTAASLALLRATLTIRSATWSATPASCPPASTWWSARSAAAKWSGVWMKKIWNALKHATSLSEEKTIKRGKKKIPVLTTNIKLICKKNYLNSSAISLKNYFKTSFCIVMLFHLTLKYFRSLQFKIFWQHRNLLSGRHLRQPLDRGLSLRRHRRRQCIRQRHDLRLRRCKVIHQPRSSSEGCSDWIVGCADLKVVTGITIFETKSSFSLWKT